MDLSVMPKLFADQHHWYLSTLASVSDVAGMSTASAATFTASSKLLYSYTHVVNGFSASLTPSELEALKKSPGYVSSIKDLPVKHDTTHSLEYLGLTPQSPVWKASNYGDGIIIGLVDTGVWPESESYSDHGMPEIPETWRGECEVLTLGNGISIAGSSFYLGSSSFSEVPIVFKDGCHIMSELIKIGPKIVVCEGAFDSNDLSDQVENVSSANVTAGVFITNFTDTEGFIGNKFPVVIVSLRDGKTITDYIKNSNSPQASAEFRKTNLGIKPAPRVTSYSSRGPSASCPLVLKPDIMAPGSLILAAWPQNIAVDSNNSLPLFSNFNILSGTSMACPHAAGVAALLRKAHPDWSPAAIRSAMVTTADTMDNNMEPIKDIGFGNRINPASPLDMGAGQVNPNNALDPGLIYDVNSTDYVRLLCATNFTEKQIQVITGSSSTDCSNPSNDLNYPSFIAYFNEKNSPSNLTIVREFHRTVTNVGEGICSYTASVTPMSGLKVNVMPDKLEFKTKYEKLSYKLTIEGPALLDKTVTFGYLEWADSGGKHVVRSPIAATSLSPELS
ncbi:hypothetical protein OIU78_016168 [Salix suchowensis]|nr:hypothetical protein OIU78_016168 [Salix suchowensis]